jgi:TPR repeat protein
VGLGVPQNNIKAYAWLKLAAQGKNLEATKELKALEEKLSIEEKKEAENIIKNTQLTDNKNK